ncbi:uncharacterized protein [Drosophila pseudoobscura]|uniref:Uncharacterized protein n=1 Tax=Drosophila pseudoobscura pseudoobscura TaxID=46245 RepID=A0A6I8UY82_DROPS|nr:uncharacterized protein LOC6902746 [Drosophila pseudoobscura]
MLKLRDIIYFVLLTGIHVCAVIQPTVEVNAKLNWSSSNVDRSLRLNVGYQYKPLMLTRSMMYSLLTMIGLWHGRHRDAVKRAEKRQDEIERRARRGSILIRSYSSQLERARQLMNEWVRRQKEASLSDLQEDEAALDAELNQSEGSYFPWWKFLLIALPWTLTFVVAGMLNYGRLYLVIQNFSLTHWQTVMLYAKIQMLFLHRMIEVSLASYWRQFPVTVDNYISLETHLLATE